MRDWQKRFSLEGRRALITGATKGIGFETCKVLADAGVVDVVSPLQMIAPEIIRTVR